MADLSGLFAPTRVAVIGATEREGSVGRALIVNLLEWFEGEVVPVNPETESVLGVDCVDAIGDAGAVDLAVVAVPATVAVEVTRECGEAGVRNVVVVTAGFGESGSEGAARERELREIASSYDLDLVGPNCLGVLSTPPGLNASFAPGNPLLGSISFMSQSGAFVTAVIDWASDRDLGFKDIVSLGNKAVLDETAFVDHWGDDPGTDVILAYLESIEDGRAFIDRARETVESTPVVAIKSGRTDAGAQAASSHTGAIAGSERAYEAGLDAAGVIRVETVQELFDVAQALADQPLPASDTVAIVTNAGGPGVMTTDAVGDSDLSLAGFEEGTIETLRKALPAGANVYNPVDVIGDADAERFGEALDAVLSDPNVGSAIALACPTAVLEYANLAEVVADRQAAHGLPVVACLMGGETSQAAAATLRDAGIPNYFDPARAVSSLAALSAYREIRERKFAPPMSFDVDRDRAREVLETVRDRPDNRLGVEAMDLLSAYGIPTPRGEVVTTPEAAHEVAADIGEAVVMKIVSPDILHKSDIGGVAVGVSPGDVKDTYEDLLTRARNYQPDATILGIQVQELVDLDRGTETILGMNRDPQFGPLLLFGLGGIFVEIMEDTSVRLAPVSDPEAREMTREIDSAPLLRGARGRDPVDLDAVVDAIGRLSQLVTDFEAIVELDVNPLVATTEGVQALDVRLTVEPEKL
jgi:acetyltransferase